MPKHKNDEILFFNVQKINNFALTLENKSDVTVQEFI